MEPQMYQSLIDLEHRHWWFLGRRKIAEWVLRKAELPPNTQILDIGTGAGGNMVTLAKYGQVHGVEYEPMVREHALKHGIGPVENGKLPHDLPYGNKRFDLITMFDVLEHVEEDMESMKAMYARLNPGGYVYINVPAFQWMMSDHDTLNHHKRRYSRTQIRALFEQAGFDLCFINHSNFFLFPILVLVRVVDFFARPESREYRFTVGQGMPSPFMNKLLYRIMISERAIMNLPLPFGISIVALARKPKNKA